MYSIRLDGDVRKLMKKLHDLEDVDLKKSRLTLAEALRSSTKKRFKDEEAPDGSAWKKSNRAAAEGGTTLTNKSRLKNSIKSKATESGFAVGTNVIYARTHQFGEKGRRVTIRAKTSKGLVFKIGDKWIRKREVTATIKIPKRPFLGISDEDMKEIKDTLEDMISEG